MINSSYLGRRVCRQFLVVRVQRAMERVNVFVRQRLRRTIDGKGVQQVIWAIISLLHTSVLVFIIFLIQQFTCAS